MPSARRRRYAERVRSVGVPADDTTILEIPMGIKFSGWRATESERVWLKPIGTLGILLAAKWAGAIDFVSEYIDALRAAGMYLSEPLVRRVLAKAGELE
ncbi:MAG: DUF3368 domain-containing protein [Armatimonadota bacterium]